MCMCILSDFSQQLLCRHCNVIDFAIFALSVTLFTTYLSFCSPFLEKTFFYLLFVCIARFNCLFYVFISPLLLPSVKCARFISILNHCNRLANDTFICSVHFNLAQTKYKSLFLSINCNNCFALFFLTTALFRLMSVLQCQFNFKLFLLENAIKPI